MRGADEEGWETNPCVVLLDIRMPRLDGVEVLRQMKDNPRLKSIPVIVLSTSGNPEIIQKCIGLGSENYIIKPVNFNEFWAMIRNLSAIISKKKHPSGAI